jgi:hypothetical protein
MWMTRAAANLECWSQTLGGRRAAQVLRHKTTQSLLTLCDTRQGKQGKQQWRGDEPEGASSTVLMDFETVDARGRGADEHGLRPPAGGNVSGEGHARAVSVTIGPETNDEGWWRVVEGGGGGGGMRGGGGW